MVVISGDPPVPEIPSQRDDHALSRLFEADRLAAESEPIACQVIMMGGECGSVVRGERREE